MPRDLPDWGALSAQQVVYEITDLGELAARLGSIDTFDRRGDVIWMDDFECGLKAWRVFGGTADLSRSRALSGCYSARLVDASVTHEEPYPVLTPMGVEMTFSGLGSVTWVQFRMDLYDGANLSSAWVRWQSAGTLEILGPFGTWVQVATGVEFDDEPTRFDHWKLVVNWDAGRYERLLVNSTTYVLTSYGFYVSVDTSTPRLSIDVHTSGGTVYLDNVILTYNEPTEGA